MTPAYMDLYIIEMRIKWQKFVISVLLFLTIYASPLWWTPKYKTGFEAVGDGVYARCSQAESASIIEI